MTQAKTVIQRLLGTKARNLLFKVSLRQASDVSEIFFHGISANDSSLPYASDGAIYAVGFPSMANATKA